VPEPIYGRFNSQKNSPEKSCSAIYPSLWILCDGLGKPSLGILHNWQRAASYILFFAKESWVAFAAFFGDSDLAATAAASSLKKPTRIRPKELVHRDTDPARILNFLSKLSKEGVLNHVTRSLYHRDNKAIGGKISLDIFSQPNFHKIHRLFRRVLRHQPSIQAG
jgi:hypothetical protein